MKLSWLSLSIGAAIVVGSFYITLLAMDHFGPHSPCDAAPFALQGPFAKYPGPGAAYISNLPASWSEFSDNSTNPTRSNALVCENNVPMGPPHTRHDDVADKGKGRFSHWGTQVTFSATDNSDPNVNQRRYTIVRR